MQPVDWNHIITEFSGNLPTFITVILAWIHTNARTKEAKESLTKRIDDSNARFDKRIDDLRELMRSEFTSLRAELKLEQTTIIPGR